MFELRILEQQGGTACTQRAVADFRDLKIGIDFRLDPDQIALLLQEGDEFTKVFAGHWRDPERYFHL